MIFVELNNSLQRVYWRSWPQASKVSIQIGFQFVHKHRGFRLVKLSTGFNIRGINEYRSLRFQHFKSAPHKIVDCGVEAKSSAHDTDARATQSVGHQKL